MVRLTDAIMLEFLQGLSSFTAITDMALNFFTHTSGNYRWYFIRCFQQEGELGFFASCSSLVKKTTRISFWFFITLHLLLRHVSSITARRKIIMNECVDTLYWKLMCEGSLNTLSYGKHCLSKLNKKYVFVLPSNGVSLTDEMTSANACTLIIYGIED